MSFLISLLMNSSAIASFSGVISVFLLQLSVEHARIPDSARVFRVGVNFMVFIHIGRVCVLVHARRCTYVKYEYKVGESRKKSSVWGDYVRASA